MKQVYTSRRSRLLINGHLSAPFSIDRGVLQGDPLSPLLFVFALESLYNTLRLQTHLGLRIGTKVHTTSGFADDTQLIAKDADSFTDLVAIVERFCPLSGFKLNRGKAVILTYSELPLSLEVLRVTVTALTKALGILVAPDLPPQARFDYICQRFLNRLRLWSHKSSTYAGKACSQSVFPCSDIN